MAPREQDDRSRTVRSFQPCAGDDQHGVGWVGLYVLKRMSLYV